LTDSEELRYREYLQRSLLWPGAENLFDHAHFRDWSIRNTDHLGKLSSLDLDASVVGEYLRQITSFTPATPLEGFAAGRIFQPLLDQSLPILQSLGLEIQHPVALATSTSLSPTPYARPGVGGHQLFIGVGTFAFCNYWSKVFAVLFTGLAELQKLPGPMGADDIAAALPLHPHLSFLAARLAAYYGVYETVVQFGPVKIPAVGEPYRLELLRAMEAFVLGHELGHFAFEERDTSLQGVLDERSSIQLEHACDDVGFAISQTLGGADGNWSAFAGTGALLFLHAIELCCNAQSVIQPNKVCNAGTHPAASARIARLRGRLATRTLETQREATLAFFDEANMIATCLRDHVFAILKQVASDANK
jgi:hypothetical protein